MYYFVLDQHLLGKIKDETRHLKPRLLDQLISSSWLHVNRGEIVENYGQVPARRPEGTIAGVKMAFDLSDPAAPSLCKCTTQGTEEAAHFICLGNALQVFFKESIYKM